MPVEFLTATEREKLSRFPFEIPREDLISHFTLSEEDLKEIEKQRRAHNRFRFALRLAALRYLGFFPTDLTDAPEEAKRYLADQIGADPAVLNARGERPKTQQEHQLRAMAHVGFRWLEDEQDWERIQEWLTERALEHDRPSALIEAACEKLRREQFVRPGITVTRGAWWRPPGPRRIMFRCGDLLRF